MPCPHSRESGEGARRPCCRIVSRPGFGSFDVLPNRLTPRVGVVWRVAESSHPARVGSFGLLPNRLTPRLGSFGVLPNRLTPGLEILGAAAELSRERLREAPRGDSARAWAKLPPGVRMYRHEAGRASAGVRRFWHEAGRASAGVRRFGTRLGGALPPGQTIRHEPWRSSAGVRRFGTRLGASFRRGETIRHEPGRASAGVRRFGTRLGASFRRGGEDDSARRRTSPTPVLGRFGTTSGDVFPSSNSVPGGWTRGPRVGVCPL